MQTPVVSQRLDFSILGLCFQCAWSGLVAWDPAQSLSSRPSRVLEEALNLWEKPPCKVSGRLGLGFV